MDGLRTKGFRLGLDRCAGGTGKPDLRIRGHGQGGETVRAQDLDHVAIAPEKIGDGPQGPHNTIHLRFPGIRDDQDTRGRLGEQAGQPVHPPHQAGTGCAGGVARRSRTEQSSSSKRPSGCSTRAVQDSTQSPVFM